MFVQFIEGPVSDPAAARAAVERWVSELSPGADGWLGTTAGVTEQGRLVVLARFASEEAARRSSDRPEQDAWWAETSKIYTEAPTFRDSTQVIPDVVGDPDTAGFVQVMHGRGTDNERAGELMSQDSDVWAEFRPDILGSLALLHDDGTYTMAIYFTSEADAREGEKKEPPEALREQMAELDKLSDGIPDFYDLKEPWLFSRS